MSRILTYAAGLLTGVMIGIIGTGALISYTELETPGIGANYSKFMDAIAK